MPCGWYLERAVDESRGFTLIKVGFADNIADRIKQHTSGARAHMPEALVLLRAYQCDNPRQSEQTFHKLLETARHENPRRSVSRRSEIGREWFLTSEDFLDSVADALKLRTLYIGQSEFAAA